MGGRGGGGRGGGGRSRLGPAGLREAAWRGNGQGRADGNSGAGLGNPAWAGNFLANTCLEVSRPFCRRSSQQIHPRDAAARPFRAAPAAAATVPRPATMFYFHCPPQLEGECHCWVGARALGTGGGLGGLSRSQAGPSTPGRRRGPARRDLGFPPPALGQAVERLFGLALGSPLPASRGPLATCLSSLAGRASGDPGKRQSGRCPCSASNRAAFRRWGRPALPPPSPGAAAVFHPWPFASGPGEWERGSPPRRPPVRSRSAVRSVRPS